FALAIRPGDVVLITGPSGSGKSTLLRHISRLLSLRRNLTLKILANTPPPAVAAVVDCLDLPLVQAARLLAMAGLPEARLLLRTPAELSEGERFRFRLAQFLASAADVMLADEFAAVLDRVTARAVAWRLGKFIRASTGTRQPRISILATSHED